MDAFAPCPHCLELRRIHLTSNGNLVFFFVFHENNCLFILLSILAPGEPPSIFLFRYDEVSRAASANR